MLSLAELLESAGVGLSLSILGTYLLSRRNGAEALDAGLRDTISVRESTIGTLKSSIHTLQTLLKEPAVSKHELDARQRVRNLLAGANCTESNVLRFLIDHGESFNEDVYRSSSLEAR